MTEDDIVWTPIQKAMVELLSDGQSHTITELNACRAPSSEVTISRHLAAIREKLLPIGQTIISEYWNRKCFYRRVILYGPASPVSAQKQSADA
jgi:hypothetical protein